jgi:SRSO17 transposase
MIRRAKARQLPFEAVVCDDLYGRDSHFRAELDAEGIRY